MKIVRSVAVMLVLFGCPMATSIAANPQDRPNVLFIPVDDMNDWVGHLGGHPQTVTPNLDRLAERGVAFRNDAGNLAAAIRNVVFLERDPHWLFDLGLHKLPCKLGLLALCLRTRLCRLGTALRLRCRLI